MSDDLREREPQRDQGDFPTEPGLRSDHAGTGNGIVGPAPAGGDPQRAREAAEDRPIEVAGGPAGEPDPSTGMGGTASGGYGSASGRSSSGGSGEGQEPAGKDDQTDWLRSGPKDTA